MNLSTLTIGKRITVGFGLLIAILLILSTISVVQMIQSERRASLLADDIAPLNTAASQLLAEIDEFRLNARVLGLTGRDQDRDLALEWQQKVTTSLAAMRSLVNSRAGLTQAVPYVTRFEQGFGEYTSILQQTIDIWQGINAVQADLGTAAGEATKEIEAFLASQEEAIMREISQAAAPEALRERAQKIIDTNTVLDYLNDTRRANYSAQASRDPAIFIAALPNLAEARDMVGRIRTTTRAADNLRQLDVINNNLTTYENQSRAYADAVGRMVENNTRRARAGEALAQVTAETINFASETTATASQEVADELAASEIVLIIGSLVALVIGIVIALVIARSITSVLSLTASSLSEGSDQVASASGQISSASQSLAEGASEQAASLEETSASLEEIASMTKRNAENANSAKDLSGETRSAAETGAGNMEAMNRAMADIQTASDNISKIIKTIDEIAFQTNILALNAAVEAARAGEAGMGFAVVADEVRSLAQRSAQAAKETADKIEDSIRKSANGVELSGKVTESLSQIVDKARQVDELVAEIATASREQSQGIDQVNTAVTQMDKVTQTNAAAAEESASASEELNAQAATLREIVTELQKLVTGSGGASGGGYAAAPRQVLHTRPYQPGHGSAPSSSKPRIEKSGPPSFSGERPKLGPSKKKRQAEDEIPMDEGFKDF